jgi:hypothetical protein
MSFWMPTHKVRCLRYHGTKVYGVRTYGTWLLVAATARCRPVGPIGAGPRPDHAHCRD